MIVVLWVLVILSMLAVGLARKVKVDLALTKYAVGKAKSRAIAMAGLAYAMSHISQDSQDQQAGRVDTKFQCGFVLKDQNTVENLFKQKAVGDGYFTLSYQAVDEDNQRLTRYGFQDEESRLNINGLNSNNYKMLKYLMSDLGFDDDVAETVASSAVDWIDADNEVFFKKQLQKALEKDQDFASQLTDLIEQAKSDPSINIGGDGVVAKNNSTAVGKISIGGNMDGNFVIGNNNQVNNKKK